LKYDFVKLKKKKLFLVETICYRNFVFRNYDTPSTPVAVFSLYFHVSVPKASFFYVT